MSTEGINGTVGGSVLATDIYIKTMCAHALFNSMEEDDFKVRWRSQNQCSHSSDSMVRLGSQSDID